VGAVLGFLGETNYGVNEGASSPVKIGAQAGQFAKQDRHLRMIERRIGIRQNKS